MSNQGNLGAGKERLAELGYKQELKRSRSGFTNFAISSRSSRSWWADYGFGTGLVTVARSRLVGLADRLRVDPADRPLHRRAGVASPTAGGLYYWASKLGGPVWGWFTGWFNLIGLMGVVASVDYACGAFLSDHDLKLFESELGCAPTSSGCSSSTCVCSPAGPHDPERVSRVTSSRTGTTRRRCGT